MLRRRVAKTVTPATVPNSAPKIKIRFVRDERRGSAFRRTGPLFLRRAISRRASFSPRVESWSPTPAAPPPKTFAACMAEPPVVVAIARIRPDFDVLVMPSLFHMQA